MATGGGHLQSHRAAQWNQLKAADLTTADQITVETGTLAIDAIERMERNRRQAIGVQRLHDLVQAGLA